MILTGKAASTAHGTSYLRHVSDCTKYSSSSLELTEKTAFTNTGSEPVCSEQGETWPPGLLYYNRPELLHGVVAYAQLLF